MTDQASDGESSPSRMWAALQDQLRVMREQAREIARLQAALDEALHPGRRRIHYPDGERDLEGRHVGTCVGCGRELVLHAKRRCEACYRRWLRVRRQPKLGCIPVHVVRGHKGISIVERDSGE